MASCAVGVADAGGEGGGEVIVAGEDGGGAVVGVHGCAGVCHVAKVLHVHAVGAGGGVYAGRGEDGDPFVGEAALRVLDGEMRVVDSGVFDELLVGALAVVGVEGGRSAGGC